MKKLAGGEIQIDVRLYYSPTTMYRLFDAYGEEGRNNFCKMLYVDMVFPAVYTAAIYCLADVLNDNEVIGGMAKNIICALVILAAFFDYCENTLLLRILAIFPQKSRSLSWMSACASTLKMICSNIAVLSLILSVFLSLF